MNTAGSGGSCLTLELYGDDSSPVDDNVLRDEEGRFETVVKLWEKPMGGPPV